MEFRNDLSNFLLDGTLPPLYSFAGDRSGRSVDQNRLRNIKIASIGIEWLKNHNGEYIPEGAGLQN